MELEPTQIALAGGLIIGLLFGSIAQATSFCSSGAILDLARDGNGNRLRAWGLAAAVAILVSQILLAFGFVDLRKSIYVTAPLALGGMVTGGIMFGIGMILAQGCAARNLVRLGSGNLRSLVVVLVFAATAYATMRGILAPLRIGFDSATRSDLSTQGIPELVARYVHIDASLSRWIVALGATTLLVTLCLANKSFRASPRNLIAGCVVGLLIAAGWYLTGFLAYDEFNPAAPTSLAFVAPLGDGLQYLMFFTGVSANLGITLAAGVILGSFVTSLFRKRFRIEGFNDQGDFFRQIVGSVLMGVGSVMAAGCTIGHGLTGLSALSIGSVISASAIVGGGFIGAYLTGRPISRKNLPTSSQGDLEVRPSV